MESRKEGLPQLLITLCSVYLFGLDIEVFGARTEVKYQ